MTDTSFGKFKLIAELGHGGMADVFLAVQAGPAGSGFKKLTVVKRLRQNLAEEPEFVAMLVDEARIAARLNHPNVVQTNEVGHVTNQYFIAMEYLDGQPLHRIQHRSANRVKEGKPPVFTTEHQYLVIMDTLAGLHHAHELADYDGTPLQIVHRDITPHNIFVTYAGQVKVVDFGIAKAVGRASETRQGVVKGKVRYMAPEQALGQDVDRRADVFAAGVMLWEAATGRRLWKGEDDLRIVSALLAGKLQSSPREVEPTVPEAIDRICRKALALRKEDRYATAEDFRADLEQYMVESGLLLPTRRGLALAVSELFDDKRREIKAIIEKQLAALDVLGTGEVSAVAIGSDPRTSSPSAVSAVARAAAVAAGASQQVAAVPPARSTAALRYGAIVAVAFAALTTIAIIAWRGAPRAEATTTNANTTAPRDVTIRLTGNPTTAKARIDDGQERGTPLEMRVPRDEREHTVRIEADGYEGTTQLVWFVKDVSLTFDLRKYEAEPHAGAKAGAHAPAAPAWHPPPVVARQPDPKPATAGTPAKAPEDVPAPPVGTGAKPASDPAKGRNLAIDKNDPWAN